jgi:hypothetical protein
MKVIRTGDWASFITYPTGITLGAGDSLSVVWVTTIAHPVPEVFNRRGRPGRPARLQRGLRDVHLHGHGVPDLRPSEKRRLQWPLLAAPKPSRAGSRASTR